MLLLTVSGVRDQQNITSSKSGIWRCSICTYDNDGSMSCCEMCGVLQGSSVNVSKDGQTNQKELCEFDSYFVSLTY